MLLRKPLEKNKVEAGKVFIQPIYNGGLITISLLTVYPHSKIAVHTHKKDREWYLNIQTGESLYCDIGGSHEYANNSDKKQLILSIKVKAELESEA